ncbi:MAG: DUF6259 domain-containing protein [Eubacteriales bacterium]|nr:DUF6259 domain-containing protein [Eubacteriales bacterium]
MITLKNDKLRLQLDDRGRLVWLEDLTSENGNRIANPKPIFRAAILRTQDAAQMGENKEDTAFAEEQDVSVALEGETAVVTVKNLKTHMGEKAAEIRLTVTLDGDHVRFSGTIRNDSDSCIDELIYPCVGEFDSLGDGEVDLLYPMQSGERVNHIVSVLKSKGGRESLHEMAETYPGHLSMSWMALTDEKNCLSLAAHDPLFHVVSMRVKGDVYGRGGVSLEMDKMCFVNKGETWEIPEFVLKMYQGSWRKAADEYVQWANTWRHPIEPTEWMKRLNGYFLVINKQQFGNECWPYDTLPELYEHAQAHGYDCLGLFGWYHTGHDNNYPDLEVSPTMGGAEGLKAGIKAVQEKGGHVTLYYQGHLMDLNSPFYKAEGEKWEGKNIWGNPYYEFYPKFCYSDVLRVFSRKAFSTICPSVTKWHGMMAERIDWVASFGADGALYDQIGGMPPYLCFNPAHNHLNNKPSLSYTQGRLRLFPAIRERVERHENFAFMSEHITDLYSQFLDCVHGIGSTPSARQGGMIAGPGMRNPNTGASMMPELFRYCFPGTMITLRNPQPMMDERLVNYGFLFGFKFEMELRYDTDQRFIREDAAPERRVYAKKVSDLRRKYEDFLLLGTFRADEGIEHANVYADTFVAADGRRAVALWNDSLETIRLDLALTKGTVASWATVDGEGSGMLERMAPNSVALLLIQD